MFVYLEGNFFLIATFKKAIDFLFKKIQSNGKSLIVLPCSLNDLAVSWSSKSISNSYRNVDYCTCDSMFLTYFFRLKYKKKIDRVYGPDLMKAILSIDRINLNKHYFLSPNIETSNKFISFIKKSYPKTKAEFGFLPKKISEIKEKELLENILKNKPNFIWLGIGSPKQIQLATYLKQNSSGIKIFCVGAAFDFLTGQKKQAPYLMRVYGLEWLFRLSTEPSRLWKRYLIVVPLYLSSVIWRKIFPKKSI